MQLRIRSLRILPLLGLFALACEEEPKPAAASANPEPAAAPEPKPEPKSVPKDVEAFLKWVDQAKAAIEKGPEPGAEHAALGKVSCQEQKEAPDVGYCGSSKEGPPRFTTQWSKKEPKLWAVSVVLENAVEHVDCALLGKTEVSKSDTKNVVSRRCKYSADADMLIRHSVPAGAARSTQIWVFSRDFPEQDEKAAHSPRSTLHAKLNEWCVVTRRMFWSHVGLACSPLAALFQRVQVPSR